MIRTALINLCWPLLLAVAFGGCVTKAKAKAEANAAYRAGQQEALARMQQQLRVPSVTVVGQVSVPTIPWIEDLTLAKALVTANYTGRTDPTEILIVRNGRAFRVDPKQLLSGEDVPLQAGDVVQIKQ